MPYPIDLAHYAPVLAAARRAVPGCQRGRGLRHWFAGAGLVEVWQRTTLIERWAPLRPVERPFIGDALAFDAGLAEDLALPPGARAFWRAQRDPASPDALVNRPDFSSCE